MRFRLDSLRVKLFLAIAGANLVLVMAAYLIYGWSFDQGLGEYLNKTETARLDPLVARLAEGYRQNGSWEWLTRERSTWPEMVRDELGGGRGRRGEERARGDVANLPPLTMDPRLLVLDVDGEVLTGFRERAAQALRKPVVVEGRTVGFLAYVPRLQMVESLEPLVVGRHEDNGDGKQHGTGEEQIRQHCIVGRVPAPLQGDGHQGPEADLHVAQEDRRAGHP